MRKAPSFSELLNYPATAGVGLLSIAVGVLSLVSPARTEALEMDGRAFVGEPWRIVTTVLVHGDFLHLAFNLGCLWLFGTALEKRFGSAALLAGMILCGATATCAEYALLGGGIGLSGVGYGLFGTCWMLAIYDPRERDLVDDRVVVGALVWGMLCVVTTVIDVLPVANVAHAAGLVFGVLTGLAVAKKRIYALACIAFAGLTLLGATRGRVYVNIGRASAAKSLAWAGQELGDAGDYTRSAKLYEQAVALAHNPGHATNLGYAYGKLERYEEARAQYDFACERGEMIACSNLGIQYEYGKGGPLDVEKARAYYRRACAGHNRDGCENEARYSK